MPYAPGESGNLRGRPPKGESLTDALKHLLSKRGNRAAVAQKVYDLALQGNMPAMQLMWERAEGKVPTEDKHSGTFLIRIVEGDEHADDHEADG